MIKILIMIIIVVMIVLSVIKIIVFDLGAYLLFCALLLADILQ